MASPGKRREMDLMKLMMADYDVQMCDGDNVGAFYVRFHGPKDTPYEGGVWKVHVELPEAYPYKSPSIGFINRLFHPNVDEMSGSVCLDVINQTWSPMYDLKNIFDIFLPQLLTYPNPTDPLNGEAAALQMREPERYEAKVKDMVARYAKPEDYPQGATAAGDEDSGSGGGGGGNTNGEANDGDDSDFDDDGGGSMSSDGFDGGADGAAGAGGNRDGSGRGGDGGAGPSAPDTTFDL